MENPTITVAIELYADDKSIDCAQATVRSHRSRLRQFREWADENGIESLNDITPIHLLEYKQDRGEEVAKRTLKTQLDTLRVFLRFCSDAGFVSADLSEAVLSPSMSETHSRDDILDADAAQAILSRLNKYRYASIEHIIFLLLYRCLIRRGALRGIDLNDCSLSGDDPTIKLSHRPETGTPLKNKADGERIVAIGEEVRDTVQDYINDVRIEIKDDHGRSPLLTTEHGRPHGQTIQGIVYGLTRPCIVTECPHDRNPDECDAAQNRYKSYECPSSVSPHPLRRGAITHWLDQDIPIEIISERCNTAPDVIRDYYDERTEKQKAEQRRKYLEQIE